MGHRARDCKARSGRWLARKLCKNGALGFFDQTTGKTTLATNLAGAFAADHRRVVLVDIDPQRSALEWAETRPEAAPQIPVLSLQGTEDAWRRALAPLREAYEVIEHVRE